MPVTDKPPKLKKQELNKVFLNGLNGYVKWSSGEDSAPLLIDIETLSGIEYRLRAYLFNLTNPPGGRAVKRKERKLY